MRMHSQDADPLAGLRVGAQNEVDSLLRRLIESATLLHLSAPDGCVYTTSMNQFDPTRRRIGFAAEPMHPQVQRLLELNEATAVGFVDNVKLQFDLQHLVLVRGERACTLQGDMPRELFRFQRRGSFRVRVPARGTPHAQLRHPSMPDMALSLRVLDVSAEGCALLLPSDVPLFEPGVQINDVRLELDADTRIQTALQLQHVTVLNPQGARLGCTLVGASGEAQRALQRYVDLAQRRRRLVPVE